MRFHGKIDGNQKQIVSALRSIGARVESLANVGGGVPDLLVLFGGQVHLLEIKKDSKAKLTTEQEQWHLEWQCSKVHIVTTVEAALIAVGAIASERRTIVTQN